MRPIPETSVIQIDIVGGACHLSCANCTRHIGHHRDPQVMTLDEIRTAIRSLDGYPGRVGMMGGEPCLHPEFREVLSIWREMVPRHKREFWTAGFRWEEYRDDIYATFDPDLIHYNDHTQHTGRHQPLLVALDEVIEDPDLRRALIDACPYQAAWSPSIRKSGAYFCEIGGSLADLMGRKGWKVEPGWWDKTPDQFGDQLDICQKCSGCLPMEKHSDGRGGRDGPTVDVVSPGMLQMLLKAKSPKAARGNVSVFEAKLTREDIEARKAGWKPREFRDFVAHNPEDVEAALNG